MRDTQRITSRVLQYCDLFSNNPVKHQKWLEEKVNFHKEERMFQNSVFPVLTQTNEATELLQEKGKCSAVQEERCMKHLINANCFFQASGVSMAKCFLCVQLRKGWSSSMNPHRLDRNVF